MSLIFKALQRFQQPGVVPKDKPEAMALQRKGYAFRKIFLAPVFLLGVAVTILAMGFLIFHNITWFSGGGQQLTPMAEAAPSNKTIETRKIESEPRGMEDLPEPDLSVQLSVEPEPEVRYQFHTPGENNQNDIAKSASIQTDQPSHSSLPWPGRQTALKTQLPDVPVSAGVAAELPSASSVADDPGQPTYENGAGKVLGSQAAFSQPVDPNVFLPLKSNVDRDNQGATTKASVIDPPDHLKPMRKQQQQASRATRHLRIARLVDEILSAIRTDEVERASKLLNQLVQMKGPKDPFVSKLRAYSFIRQSRLEEARSLLTEVLSRNADDIEAGLNMAVIDIKSGRYREARSRLTSLQAIYPEQDQVAIYLEQLPR